MLKIRMEQFRALEAQWERTRRAAVVELLRLEIPEVLAAMSDAQLNADLEDGWKAAGLLGIRDTHHLYRFIRLRYLPNSAWLRSGAQDVLLRVLTDTSIDAARRLKFVENGIVKLALDPLLELLR